MLSPQEFIVRWPADDVVRLLPDWGTDELIRYDPAILETISLPEESRRFLAQAGLPGQALYSLRFDLPPNNLPPLPEAEALAGKYSFPPDYRRYRLMGASFHKISQAVGYRLVNFTFYCLDEQEGGRVVCVWQDPGRPVEFFNSSVVAFAEFLLILREHRAWRLRMGEVTEEVAIAHGRELVHRMKQVDPAACQPGAEWYEELLALEAGW